VVTVRAPAQPDFYRAPTLALYDWYVLGFMNYVVWRCPTRELLAQYDAHVSGHHLDVGVGTGYYLDRCRFPTPRPSLMLLDLSVHPLRWAKRRLRRYRPRLKAASVLAPIDLDGERFDSIGLCYVIHCLPGDPAIRAEAFGHLRALLNPGGVLFGSTLLARGVQRGLLARGFTTFFNALGALGNARDDRVWLEQALGKHFREVEIRMVGCAALFVARA
jgi:SAM-dependent methyltransferase